MFWPPSMPTLLDFSPAFYVDQTVDGFAIKRLILPYTRRFIINSNVSQTGAPVVIWRESRNKNNVKIFWGKNDYIYLKHLLGLIVKSTLLGIYLFQNYMYSKIPLSSKQKLLLLLFKGESLRLSYAGANKHILLYYISGYI